LFLAVAGYPWTSRYEHHDIDEFIFNAKYYTLKPHYSNKSISLLSYKCVVLNTYGMEIASREVKSPAVEAGFGDHVSCRCVSRSVQAAIHQDQHIDNRLIATRTLAMAANRGYDVVVDVDTEVKSTTPPLSGYSPFHRATSATPISEKTSNSTRPVHPPLPRPFTRLIHPAFEDGPQRSKPPPNTSSPFASSSDALASKRFLWTLSFYAQFFDVDTGEVLRRCRVALYPRANFLDILDGNPDLYGPFWIATTVVFILFMTGTISQYLAKSGEGHFQYDFTLLSGASGLIYGYTFVIPVVLWGVLKWFGSEGANVLECWALYGYANLIWIPVALISWSPITILNYVFVAIGFGVSALFLVRNLWPLVSATDQKVSRVLLIAVVALHAGLAIAIKILFFA
jgi:hypothetical protein